MALSSPRWRRSGTGLAQDWHRSGSSRWCLLRDVRRMATSSSLRRGLAQNTSPDSHVLLFGWQRQVTSAGTHDTRVFTSTHTYLWIPQRCPPGSRLSQRSVLTLFCPGLALFLPAPHLPACPRGSVQLRPFPLPSRSRFSLLSCKAQGDLPGGGACLDSPSE